MTRAVNAATANTTRVHTPALAHPEGAQEYVDVQWAPDKVVDRYEWMFRYDASSVDLAPGQEETV